MFHVRRLSLLLLVIEAMLLFFPSLWGFLLTASGLFYHPILPMPLSAKVCFNMTWISLLSLWLMLICAFTKGNVYKSNLYKLLWVLATIGAIATIIALTFFTRIQNTPFGIFLLGTLFLPTYFHILFEVKRQTGSVCPIKFSHNPIFKITEVKN